MTLAYDHAQRPRKEDRFPSVQQRVADYFNAEDTTISTETSGISSTIISDIIVSA